MEWAFPTSASYEDSVTLGLAPRRRAPVPSRTNVRGRRRGHIHDLECDRCSSSIGQGVPSTKRVSMAPDGVGVSTCYRRAYIVRHWSLGFRQGSFHHITQVLQSPNLYTSSGGLRFTDMLWSLHPFGVRGVVHLEVISLELRSPVETIPAVRTMAHGFHECGSPPSSCCLMFPTWESSGMELMMTVNA